MNVWELELASKAPSTQKDYKRYFGKFLERWDVDSEELRDMRLTDLSSSDPRDHKNMERMVTAQMAEMKRSGLASSTCRMLNKAVNSFFEAQGLDLRVKAKDKPKGESIGKRMITPEEMRTLWDSPGTFRLRNRALLTFGKDAGLRVGDMANMDVGHYLEAETKQNLDGEPFKVFKPYETLKEGIIAHVHVGPEAVEAIDAYLEYRRGRGEILSKGSALFSVGRGNRYTAFILSQFFQRWRTRCGVTTEVSAHSLRKFHLTMLQTGAVPDTWIAKLQGKSTKTAFGVYSRPEELPGELTRAYMRAYDKLRIFGKAESEALEDLRLKNEELLRGLEERDERLSQVEAQVAQVVKLLDRLK
jgi:integrase